MTSTIIGLVGGILIGVVRKQYIIGFCFFALGLAMDTNVYKYLNLSLSNFTLLGLLTICTLWAILDFYKNRKKDN